MRHLRPGILLVSIFLASASSAPAEDAAAARSRFAQPPREYASAPLWVWNDLLTDDEIRSTLRDLAGQQVRQAFVHPRPGLMTPYLSPEWFRLWKVALDEAARLDMNLWIYDENSYPSGFAGGWVPELMPESRGRGLVFREAATAPRWSDEMEAVHRLEGDRAVEVSGAVKAGDALPGGRYVVSAVQRAANSPWHGDRSYVDLLQPGVTERFLEITLGAYRRELGAEFGRRVPGSFTDEPNIRPAGGLPWTPDLPEAFQKRWGYSLVANLPGLTREIGDWRRLRHNYYALLNELYVERWAKPYYEWCDRNGLQFTGHYWDHEWPNCEGVPDNMAMAAWQHTPGIDCLMNQYQESTHAQFGNVRMVRELGSVANQLGRHRTLCEIYGAGGWDLRFEDMKRIADWLAVLGVNLFDEHLSYITIRGARKRDHPQSFSYHEPWWPDYHVNAVYLTRLAAALSSGEQVHRILVLEPTTTAWMYQGNGAKLDALGQSFFSTLLALEAAQIEYDLGDEDIIARHGSVEAGKLRVGQRTYPVVVIPGLTENLDTRTRTLLREFAEQKGRLFAASLPGFKDGQALPEGDPETHALNAAATKVDRAELPGVLREAATDGFALKRAPGDRGLLFHHRRHLDDGELLFLVNTSQETGSAGTLTTPHGGIEKWDLPTGRTLPYPFSTGDQQVSATFDLPPSGSLLLFLSKAPLKPAPAHAGVPRPLIAAGPTQVERLAPNVLTLDYVDVAAGGEQRTNLYVYQAGQFVFRKNGLERNPWDSAVQFQDELIRRTFPEASGFTASYRFVIDGPVPKNLAMVIEQPGLYSITCNDHAVSAAPGAWWLDRSFGRIDLATVAHRGENVVTLLARPFTLRHELEAAYVLGDFTLRPTDRGFAIAADAPLQILESAAEPGHDVNPDGTMWLSAGIGHATGSGGGPLEDRQPFVEFDLGGPTDLGRITLWNYNEGHVRDLRSRGVQKLRLTASVTGEPETFTRDLGTFRLARAADQGLPESLPVTAQGVRFVRLDVLSNHAGTTYPAPGTPPDNGFVGLAKVRFADGAGHPLQPVTIHRVSSELASHQRVAAHLVSDRGLAPAHPGWNLQGHPFYADGVAYRQRYSIPSTGGRYAVTLPDWYGSVARVAVNGKPAGHISAPPWSCDVTGQIRQGENLVEVVVVGTLKNTLGPHHNGPGLGSAWPGMFHNGPDPGPPPGRQYHTVGYGLFAPFVLTETPAEPTAPARGLARRAARRAGAQEAE